MCQSMNQYYEIIFSAYVMLGEEFNLLLRCTFMCINKHGERYSFSLLHSSVMSAA